MKGLCTFEILFIEFLLVVKLEANIRTSDGEIEALSYLWSIFYTLRFQEVLYSKAVQAIPIYSLLLLLASHSNFNFNHGKHDNTAYIPQIIIAYQHSTPTKDLPRYIGLYNHDNDQTILLSMEKLFGNS